MPPKNILLDILESFWFPYHYGEFFTQIIFQVDKSLRLDHRPEFHRVVLQWSGDGDYPVASSTGSQISSRLLSMRAANALLTLPPKSDDKSEISTDELVEALIIAKI